MNKNSKEQQKIHNTIELLRLKQAQQLSDIKQQYTVTSQSLKPSKIIAKTILDLSQEPKLKGTVSNSILSIMTGFLSRKAIVGNSDTFFKSIIGYIVQLTTTRIVSNKIKSN